jgi:hypothetical protein
MPGGGREGYMVQGRDEAAGLGSTRAGMSCFLLQAGLDRAAHPTGCCGVDLLSGGAVPGVGCVCAGTTAALCVPWRLRPPPA